MTEEQTVSIMAAIIAAGGEMESIAVSSALELRRMVAAEFERDRNLATDKQRAAGSDAT
jgi:hypothetical protein